MFHAVLDLPLSKCVLGSLYVLCSVVATKRAPGYLNSARRQLFTGKASSRFSDNSMYEGAKHLG